MKRLVFSVEVHPRVVEVDGATPADPQGAEATGPPLELYAVEARERFPGPLILGPLSRTGECAGGEPRRPIRGPPPACTQGRSPRGSAKTAVSQHATHKTTNNHKHRRRPQTPGVRNQKETI